MREPTADETSPHEMTSEEKRRDQLLAAPGAVESDADPRVLVTEHNGVTRIDVAPDADVRPGNPYEDPEDTAGEGSATDSRPD